MTENCTQIYQIAPKNYQSTVSPPESVFEIHLPGIQDSLLHHRLISYISRINSFKPLRFHDNIIYKIRIAILGRTPD